MVEAFDLDGNEIKEEARGLLARVLQHETDHLDGVLFIDRLQPAARAAIQDALAEFEVDFQSRMATGEAPQFDAVTARIAELESLRT
jgi:peptide deformylase